MKTNRKVLAALTALTLMASGWAQDAASESKPTETKPAPAENAASTNAPTTLAKDGKVYMNFRNAPLDLVLDHMSKAAGFIINIAPGTTVSGKVDVWSNEPLSKDEAVELLNKVLHQNSLAAIRTGRTLTVVSRSEAKTRDVPVKVGNKPEDIEKNDEMVTQIIPVQYANATELVQNLTPLLPEYAQTALTANTSGNTILLTATKTDVRRMTEIISALDTAISSVSSIKVFPLKYADAKALVDAVKELFTPPQQQNNNGQRGAQFLQQMFGGGGPGGGGPFGGGGFPGGGGRGGNFGGGGGRGGGGAAGNNSQTASRVVAVADERSNSLVVAAPDAAIPTIQDLVDRLDVPVDDVTELRVFPLRNSDPQELADLLAELFPDETTGTQQFQFGGGRGGFGGFGGFGGRGGRGNQAQTSERAKKKGRVIAVAEPRTSMLVVSAASELMPQIEAMINRIDASPRGKQKVYVLPLENADPTEVQRTLAEMFDRSNQGRNNNNQNQSALQSRTQQNIQNQGQNNQGFGQGFGGGGNQGGFGNR